MWPGSKPLFDRFKLSQFGCARQQQQRRIRGNLLQCFFSECDESFIVVEVSLKCRQMTPVPGKKLPYTGIQEKFVAPVVAVTVVLVALTRKAKIRKDSLCAM